jgi:hypothetical protein
MAHSFALKPCALSRRRLAPKAFVSRSPRRYPHILRECVSRVRELKDLTFRNTGRGYARRLQHGCHGPIGHDHLARELLAKLLDLCIAMGRRGRDADFIA